MSINLTTEKFVYDVGGLITKLPTVAISVNRAPTANDFAQPGQVWIDKTTNTIYQLASITANSANWTTSPASGVGVFTSVSVNPGNVTLAAGDVTLSAGDLALTSGNVNIGGDLTVGGVFTITGDLDLTSAQLIDVTSTLNAAPSILLEANGGTSEQIRLYSNQGTAANSVYLLSDVGGITLTSTGLAAANAIDINAINGGFDLDAALQVNIASSQNATSAIVLSASAGGIDITSSGTAGEDIDISASASVNISSSEAVGDAVTITASNASGGVTIDAGSLIEIGNTATCATLDLGDFAPTVSRTTTIGGGTVVTASVTDLVDIAPDGATTNADSIKRVDVAAGNVTTGQSLVNINSGTAASGTSTVNISTGTGGGTKVVNVGNTDGLTTINLDGILNFNDSTNANIAFITGTSTGTFTVGNAAAGAIAFDTAAGISLDAATASNFTVTGGAGDDLTLLASGGSISLGSTEDDADAVIINANGGTSERVTISSSQGTGVDSLNFVSTAGGCTITTGLASADSFNIASSGGVDIDGALQVNIASSQVDASAITINASAGGLNVDSALQMNLTSSQSAVDAIRILASDASGGIDVDADSMTFDATGAISIDAAANSNISVSGAGIDLTLASAGGRVVMNGEEAANDAVRILSAAGGLDADVALDLNLASSGGNVGLVAAAGTLLLDSSGVLELNSSGAAIGIGTDADAFNINVGTGAAVRAITVGNATGATEVNVDTGTGGFNVTSGGLMALQAGTVTQASPTAAATLNVNFGVATFTGFTTASAGSQEFTITNSLVTTSSAIGVWCANEGANDAQMTVTRIERAAGSFVVTVTNNGAAALNGNIAITFLVGA